MFDFKPRVVKPREAVVAANTGALVSELTNLRVAPAPTPSAPAQPPSSARHTPPAPPDAKLKEELYELEKVIGAYKVSWIRAGAALREVCDRAVYRWKHDSFEEYLRVRWRWKKRNAYDLITAAGVAEHVREVRHMLGVSAALKLAKLPPEQQAECLSQVIAAVGSRSPTAKEVAAAVSARLPARKPSAKKTKKPKPWRIRLAGGTLTVVAKAGVDIRRLIEEALAQLGQTKVAG